MYRNHLEYLKLTIEHFEKTYDMLEKLRQREDEIYGSMPVDVKHLSEQGITIQENIEDMGRALEKFDEGLAILNEIVKRERK